MWKKYIRLKTPPSHADDDTEMWLNHSLICNLNNEKAAKRTWIHTLEAFDICQQQKLCEM